jgi:hypothetical protein
VRPAAWYLLRGGCDQDRLLVQEVLLWYPRHRCSQCFYHLAWRGRQREKKKNLTLISCRNSFKRLSVHLARRAALTPHRYPPPDEVRLQKDPGHYTERGEGKKLCVYCKASGVKSKTRLCCDQCKQPLCSPLERNCFKLYHTVPVLPTPARTSVRAKEKHPTSAKSPPSASAGPKRGVGRPRLRPPSDDEDAEDSIDLTT